jgi:hypothetical protein
VSDCRHDLVAELVVDVSQGGLINKMKFVGHISTAVTIPVNVDAAWASSLPEGDVG